MVIEVFGSGGGKSGGEAPYETPDNLRSKQKAKIVEIMSEGEISGWADPDPLKCVYLEGTPVRNENGTDNFTGVKLVSTTGGIVTDYLPGFSEQEATQSINFEITTSTPYIVTIPERESSAADAVRLTLGFPGLSLITDEGDILATSVSLTVYVDHNGGGFVARGSINVSGKTSSRYQRSIRVALPQDELGPWIIKVVRNTAESSSSKLANKSAMDALTIISETKMSYKHTAVVGIEIDAEQFPSIPARGYRNKGILVKVPSNYDPVTRIYSGTYWDGVFGAPQYCNNPAWILYDMIIEDRYGLGKYGIETDDLRWNLYQVAQYCDQLVPDGRGGYEPRYTCNLYLQDRTEAFTLLTNMASIAHAAIYGGAGGILFAQDAPRDSVALFTPANVVNGLFEYSGASLKALVSVVLVSWNDPADLYRQKIEYVEDAELVAKYGIIQKEIVAMGCTSQGQARRLGRATIYASKFEGEVETHRTGLDSYKITPGMVYDIADPTRSNVRNGGRTISASTGSITLDSQVVITAGIEHTLKVVLPDGSVATRTVSTVDETPTSVLTISPPFTDTPVKMAVWIITASDKPTEQWTCITAEEDPETGEIIVAGMKYDYNKYDLIDADEPLPPAPVYNPYLVSPPPKNVVVAAYLNKVVGVDLLISWEQAEGTRVTLLSWAVDGGDSHSVEVYGNSYTIVQASVGNYSIGLSTVNKIGIPSPGVNVTYLLESVEVLPDVANLRLLQPFVDKFASFIWDPVATATAYRVQILVGGIIKRDIVVTDYWWTYDYAESAADGGGIPFRTFDIRVKGVYGVMESANWSLISVSNAAPAVPSATVIAITGGFQISAPIPAGDSDYAGMIVWASPASGFPLAAETQLYDGVNNSANIIGLQPGVPMYVRTAFYDVFGKTGLNATPTEYVITPISNVADIDVVSTLPTTGLFEGKVVYYLTDKKLYRYDGVMWVTWTDGSDILAKSVTAGQISAVNLSSLSISGNSINTGVLVVDQFGSISAGASGYNQGVGFWLGYNNTAYKFSLGNPTGDHITWDGSTLSIYGTVSVNYSNVIGTPTNLGDINPTESAKLASIEDSATRNAFQGAYVSSGVTYEYGDVVTKDGSAWLYIFGTPTIGNAPPTLPVTQNTWWVAYATQGIQGISGANGTRTAILDVYKGSVAAPTTFPVGDSTYTWATGQFTLPATPNDWSLTPPALDVGEVLWIVRQLYTDQSTTATSAVTWAANPVPKEAGGADGIDGAAGDNGYRTAFLEMYQWLPNVPTAFPAGNSTYTWATGVFTNPGTLNGWSLTPGPSVAGQTLWGTSVRYADQGTTATTSIGWPTTGQVAYAVGAAGTNGANAPLAFLTSTAQIFTIAQDLTISPASVTFTAYQQNLAGDPVWEVIAGTASLVTVSPTVRTLTAAGLTTDSATIKITWGAVVDFITISKVREGVDGLAGANGDPGLNGLTTVLSNESHTVPSTVAGAVTSYANSGTTIQVYEGATALNATGSLPGSFSIGTPTISPALAITPGNKTTGGAIATFLEHSAMSQSVDTCTITYPITVIRADGTTASFSKVQTITKSKAGAAGTSSLVALVSNEAHIVPAANDGTVIAANLNGSGTTIRVFDGTTELLTDTSGTTLGSFRIGTPSQVPASVMSIGTISYSLTVATVANYTAMAQATHVVAVTFPVIVKRSDGSIVTINVTQSISKSLAGAPGSQGLPGESGSAVVVTTDNPASFKFNDNVLNTIQSPDITFTATVTGISSPTYVWAFTGLNSPPAPSVTNTQIITSTHFGTSRSAVISCTVLDGLGGSFTDTVTIVRLDKSTAAAGADVTKPILEAGVTITGGGITLGGSASIKGGLTSFADNTNAGFFLGNDGGVQKFKLRSAAGNVGRLEIANNVIKVYDANNILRVKLGDLSA